MDVSFQMKDSKISNYTFSKGVGITLIKDYFNLRTIQIRLPEPCNIVSSYHFNSTILKQNSLRQNSMAYYVN